MLFDFLQTHVIWLFDKHAFKHEGSDLTKNISVDERVKHIYIWMQLLQGIDIVDYNAVKSMLLQYTYLPYYGKVMKTFEIMAMSHSDYVYFNQCKQIYTEEALVYCLLHNLNDRNNIVKQLLALDHTLSTKTINLLTDLIDIRLYKDDLEKRYIQYAHFYEKELIQYIDKSTIKHDKQRTEYIISEQLDMLFVTTLELRLYEQAILFLLHASDACLNRIQNILLTNDMSDNLSILINKNHKLKTFLMNKLGYVYSVRNTACNLPISKNEYIFLFPKSTLCDLIASIMRYESNMDKDARSNGGFGLMQIEKAAYSDFQDHLVGYKHIPLSATVNDIEVNLKAGCYTLLRKMHFFYKKIANSIVNKNEMLLIASLFAYNLGEYKTLPEIQKYTKNNRCDIQDFLSHTKYSSTSRYVQNILNSIQYTHEKLDIIIKDFFDLLKCIFSKYEYGKIQYMLIT